MKVSIIVPFYNVEKYIDKCLRSLIHQTHKDIEIICIDDCSPDHSAKIVENHALNDQRIKIIKHQENKGLGGARNTGIKHARGEFICFVDSDDYVSELFVETFLKCINETSSDVCVCNYWEEDNGKLSEFLHYRYNSFNTDETRGNAVEITGKINPACTNKIFRRKVLIDNQVLQPEHRYYEGVVFWLKAVYFSSRISTIPDRLYFYRQRSGSIMNCLTEKHIDDRFAFISEIEQFVENTILLAQDTDKNKTIDDTLAYMLNHIQYGWEIIEKSCTDNKIKMEKYYQDKIVRFSMESKLPAFLTAYRFYQKHIDSIHKHQSNKKHSLFKNDFQVSLIQRMIRSKKLLFIIMTFLALSLITNLLLLIDL